MIARIRVAASSFSAVMTLCGATAAQSAPAFTSRATDTATAATQPATPSVPAPARDQAVALPRMATDPEVAASVPTRTHYPERVGYGGQAWAVLGGSLLLTPLFGVGVLGLIFGGPVVHLAHGNAGRSALALGLNVGAGLVGFGLAAAIGSCAGSCSESLKGFGLLIYGGVGAAVGLLLANVVNAEVLSYWERPDSGARRARRPQRLTLLPQLDLAPGLAQFGVAGVF